MATRKSEITSLETVTREARRVIARFNREQRFYRVCANSFSFGTDVWPEIAVVGIFLKSIKGKKISSGRDVLPKEWKKIEEELSAELTRRLRGASAKITFLPPIPY